MCLRELITAWVSGLKPLQEENVTFFQIRQVHPHPLLVTVCFYCFTCGNNEAGKVHPLPIRNSTDLSSFGSRDFILGMLILSCHTEIGRGGIYVFSK